MQQPDSSDEAVPCFIRKTYKILEDNEHSDIISWNPDGTAIIIKNPTEFAQTILPAYFKHNNINSFIRQLNMYDFHKKKTPDGEHVYYHELFQRGKKNLLKDIRRKNAESSVLNTEKSRLGLELVKTKQDIVAIINENLFLKKIQNESLSTIRNLEAKINELTIQNQALWSQLLKYRDKPDNANSFLPTIKRDTLAPLTNIDPNSRDKILNQIAQTTTLTPQFPLDTLSSKNWNLASENFGGSSLPAFYSHNLGNENQAKVVSNTPLKDPNYLESDYSSDLSQQIVKNMDQELQYLKKLTSSSNRPATDTPLSNSPNSELLGKRIFGTDLGYQTVYPYENLSKIYRPENYLGFNLLTNPGNIEGRKGFGGESY